MQKNIFNIVVDSENVNKEGYYIFNDQRFSINYCNIEDINEYENFYYIWEHTTLYQYFLKKGIVNFSENVKNAITNKNLKILFLSPHESPEDLEDFVYRLQHTIKINNWDESNFYIVNNNSLINEIKIKCKSNINFYKLNALLRMMGNMEQMDIPNDIIYNKKFIFLCLNRHPHSYRIALLTHLKSENILEDNITDWSSVIKYGPLSNKIQSIQHIKKYIDPTDKNLVKNYLEITKNKKLSFYEQNLNWFDKEDTYIQTKHLLLDSYKDSYINIVTETRFDNISHNIHITEKTFKPFYYFQLPIFVASYQHVKMLKNEYDFYLFDDLIDHSYDNEKDDAKRLYMIINEIKRLSNMREEITNYYKNNMDKLIHNYNFIKTYQQRKNEENYFFNLINENK